MEQADVSVVIPTYNSDYTIEKAVKSVANQTLLPKEVIIVDDCSTSSKMYTILNDIKNDYNNYFNIKVFYLKNNSGPATARNIGIDNAACEYIAFLDSDDIWHPQKIEIQYSYMKKNKEVYFSSHHGVIIKEQDIEAFSNKKISNNLIAVKSINPYFYLFKHYMKHTSTSSVIIKKYNGLKFYYNKRYFEDYLLWLEYNFMFQGILINENLLAVFKKEYGEIGLSANLWKMEKGELDTFKILQQRKYINIWLRYIVSCFSFLKFLRRYFIVFFNKLVI